VSTKIIQKKLNLQNFRISLFATGSLAPGFGSKGGWKPFQWLGRAWEASQTSKWMKLFGSVALGSRG
jgi:hypothetical protein